MVNQANFNRLYQANYNRLNLDQFVVGDSVIIKIKQFPAGQEYYGILHEINIKEIKIIGKPLSWVLSGDLKLDEYSFYTSSIEAIQPYTREAAEAARDKAEYIKYEIMIKELYDRLCNDALANGVSPFFDIDKLLKYITYTKPNHAA